MMRRVSAVFALMIVLAAGGCICLQSGGPVSYSTKNVSEGIAEFSSESHNGFSFQYKNTLVLDEKSSTDNPLMTSIAFTDLSGENMMAVVLMPSFIAKSGWMNETCRKDKLSQQLKSQEDVTFGEIKSVVYKDFKNLKSCFAETTAFQGGVELPMVIAFGECKGSLPMYAITGGENAMIDMELLLDSFDCNKTIDVKKD